MKNKVAVIGGSGFVGSRLLKDLETENCYNIDKNPSPFFPEITRIKNICDKDLEDSLDGDTEKLVLLAAEHRDDVSPTSLYYEVNVEGTKNVLATMDHLGIQHIVFTSSVAVYGLNKENPDEDHPADPFNHYGKSKWQAEEALRKWYHQDPDHRTLTILRPTVIFGERNRGNVYNLLRQIASGRFLMIGKGKNKKSMAYVGNVTAFLQHCLSIHEPGYRVYNYIDKPDLNMHDLVDLVMKKMDKATNTLRIPYFIGMLGGYCFDFLSRITGRNYAISSVRVKKFCATTQFDATRVNKSGFKAPITLNEGLEETLQYEFKSEHQDSITFETE
jgi:nucleoside-diphosphate-sugar epimerase